MIKANLFQDEHNGSIHLTLYGHANTGEKGKDLLCCAVTTLAYTAAQAMSYFFELAEAGKDRVREKGGTPVLMYMDFSGMK